MKSKLRKPDLGYSEVLILPDGRILAHSITPEMAGVLAELNPADEAMSRRATRKNILECKTISKPSRSRGNETQLNEKSETLHVVSYNAKNTRS